MKLLLTIAARYLYLVSTGVSVVYFFVAGKKETFLIFGLLTCVISFCIARVLHRIVQSPRPAVRHGITPLIPVSTDNGFPSDHALLVFSLASILFVFNHEIGVILFVIALVVGIARVRAGAHHSLDILGSIVIALVSTILTLAMKAIFLF